MKKVLLSIIMIVCLTFAGIVNKNVEYTIVAVPFPCPTYQAYDKVQNELLIMCDVIEEQYNSNYELIVALAPYGSSKYDDYYYDDGWWGTEIFDLKYKLENNYSYRIYYCSYGIDDEWWFNNITYTPTYLVFYYGKLIKVGNLIDINFDLLNY